MMAPEEPEAPAAAKAEEPPAAAGMPLGAPLDAEGEDSDEDDMAQPPTKKRGGHGRRKIEIEYIEDKIRRHITFSKRKAGISKKAYELSRLTGAQVLLLISSERGQIYSFATPKLQPILVNEVSKALIEQCLNAPDPMAPMQLGMDGGAGMMPPQMPQHMAGQMPPHMQQQIQQMAAMQQQALTQGHDPNMGPLAGQLVALQQVPPEMQQQAQQMQMQQQQVQQVQQQQQQQMQHQGQQQYQQVQQQQVQQQQVQQQQVQQQQVQQQQVQQQQVQQQQVQQQQLQQQQPSYVVGADGMPAQMPPLPQM